MDLNLKGRAALVQGASKGIGRGIAEALAREGCDLLLTARHEGPLKETAEEFKQRHGVNVQIDQADSGNLVEVGALVPIAERHFGRLDLVVCNSGGPPPGTMKKLEAEDWNNAAELLITSPVYLLKKALPLLAKSPAPRFFVITSSSTAMPIPGLTLSNVFRPGVHGLVKTLAEELQEEGVRCHSIAPGRFGTERLEKVIEMQAEKAGKSPAEIQEAMVASIPAGRLGEPLDIGNLVAFLSSENADYLNGGNWLVDGGMLRCL